MGAPLRWAVCSCRRKKLGEVLVGDERHPEPASPLDQPAQVLLHPRPLALEVGERHHVGVRGNRAPVPGQEGTRVDEGAAAAQLEPAVASGRERLGERDDYLGLARGPLRGVARVVAAEHEAVVEEEQTRRDEAAEGRGAFVDADAPDELLAALAASTR